MSAEQKPVNGVNNDEPMDITRTLFGLEPEETAGGGEEGGDEGTEGGGGTPPDEPEDENTDAGDEGGGDTVEDGAGSGDVWEVDGQEYTAEQVGQAIKDHEMFQRFNESINPVLETLRTYGDTQQRFQSIAMTETEKAINELTGNMATGKLDAREYQKAHMQLVQAQQRMEMLTTAAEQEKTQRTQALNTARQHNARQVVTSLLSTGWTREDLNAVDAVAQTAFRPDTFADAINPELMSILRDAAKYRKAQDDAAAKLSREGRKAVQVKTKKPVPAKKQGNKVGTDEWISETFWG